MHRILAFSLALCLSLGFISSLSPGAAAQEARLTRAAFEEVHKGALESASRGYWKKAHAVWIELLQEHAGAEYARSYLPEIREALRRAAFWGKHERPNPRDLVSGKLSRYNATTGKFKLTYTQRQLAGDFGDLADFLLHPMTFRGNYTVELIGKPSSLVGLALIVAYSAEEAYVISPGDLVKGARFYTKHSVSMIRPSVGGSQLIEDFEPAERKAKGSKKNVSLKVSVSDKKIRVTYAKKLLISFENTSGGLGRVALFGIGNSGTSLGKFNTTLEYGKSFEELIIEGQASRAWIDGTIDLAVQEKRVAFEKSYRDPKELKAWSKLKVRKRSSPSLSEMMEELEHPEDYTRLKQREVDRIEALIKDRKFESVERSVAELSDARWKPTTKEFLRLLNFLGAGKLSAATLSLERLKELKPLSKQLRVLEAFLAIAVEQRAHARDLFGALIEEYPDDLRFYFQLAQLHLLNSKLEESRTLIDKGLGISPGDAELLSLRSQVAKASQGPSWASSQRSTGKSFLVRTELNGRSARLFAKEADAALAQYERRLGALPEGQEKRKLYVFSASGGYYKYIEGVEQSNAENTLGVFSPRLKQILLWDQVERPFTIMVLRHEVMHSYMDVMLGGSPIWLSEGMAEYFANGVQRGGRWTEGQEVKEHLDAFRYLGLRKLSIEQLIYLDRSIFMENADYCYPISWAFVRYLLNSTDVNKQLFGKLWSLLEGKTDDGTALHQVFDAVDLDALNDKFWLDLESMLGAKK